MADTRAPSSKIEIRTLTVKDVASVRETIGRDDISEAMGRNFQAVGSAIAKQGAEIAGSPFARYHSFGDEIDLEAGMPVKSPITADGDVKPSQLPGGSVVLAVHAGPYESLGMTYDALEAWMTSTHRTPSGPPWEIYLTDPSNEPDPSKWLTQVIWPIDVS